MFDHYIGVDWSQNNVCLCRISKFGNKYEDRELSSEVEELKIYLKTKQGNIFLALEESTTAQWLYTELRDEVTKLVICDPRRNRLLSDGQKTDKIDARKLAELGRAGLLKEVYHSGDEFIHLRKITSGYIDTVKAGVRAKNQRSAIARANGVKDADLVKNPSDRFVLARLEPQIEQYELEKNRYKAHFEELIRKNSTLRRLKSIPGIDVIGAVIIAARVVDPRRFKHKNQFYSYSGLVKHEKQSGGRSYGRSQKGYSRQLKNVFCTAAQCALNSNKSDTYMGRYIKYLREEKRLSDHQIKRAVSRHVAALTLGVMNGKHFNKDYKRKVKLKPK